LCPGYAFAATKVSGLSGNYLPVFGVIAEPKPDIFLKKCPEKAERFVVRWKATTPKTYEH
jgi:hypothetical protein